MLTDDLLQLQRLDTTTDQLAHRRRELPERAAAAAADSAHRANRARRSQIASRDEELELAIGALEHDGDALTTQRTRLEGQLRTVIAPREAEALMHEMATIAGRRDELDDQELAHLDEQSELSGEAARLDDDLPDLEAAAGAAATALGVAEAAIDAELADIASHRTSIAATLDPSLLSRYETLRARFGGVAVATLEGSRCTGCHLDLSRSELDDVKRVPPGELTDCPECGRILVP